MKNAPILKFKNKKTTKEAMDMIPRDRMTKLFSMVSGNNGNALKLGIVLLGTKEGFAPSAKWICERTDMDRRVYYRARDYLEKIGVITVTNDTIQINI